MRVPTAAGCFMPVARVEPFIGANDIQIGKLSMPFVRGGSRMIEALPGQPEKVALRQDGPGGIRGHFQSGGVGARLSSVLRDRFVASISRPALRIPLTIVSLSRRSNGQISRTYPVVFI